MTLARPETTRLPPQEAGVQEAASSGTHALLDCQRADGHWVFELEADATIPAEYVLLRHYRGEPVAKELEQKIAVYLRRIQGAHGGWPLYHEGQFDMSASVKAYFALKMIGDRPDAPHMRRAREAMLTRGGAAESNVFTRVLLSLYGVLPWRSVPEMPVEITLLPRWFPFHLSKVSYWARTVLVPLLVLQALRPRAKNPLGIGIDELFVAPPQSVGPAAKAPHQRWIWFLLFRAIDIVLRPAVKLFPKALRRRAIDRAVEFVTERLNGDDGLGAIFPAMANATMMFDVLGNREGADIARSINRKAADRRGQRGVLPALRIAGLGHGIGLPRHAGSRRQGCLRLSISRAGLAPATPGPRRCRRLVGKTAACAARWLGVSICQCLLSRSR